MILLLFKQVRNSDQVLKVSNLSSIFYLESSHYSNSLLDYHLYRDLDHGVCFEVSMLGGLLNHFDLTVFINILHMYKSVIDLGFDGFVDINFSTVCFMYSNNDMITKGILTL
uniref:Uncharacterized protein n=1 Tax=Gracilaria hainanensis TaxID=2871843 RepID=A0AAU7YRL7_9FLOR